MASDNETVKQLCDYLANNDNSTGEPIVVAMPSLANRILAAHTREMDERDKYRNRKVFRLTQALAKCRREKDAENAWLRSLVGELAYALDASCDCHCRCDGCKMADESKFDCPDKAWRALVARAGEMIGGVK